MNNCKQAKKKKYCSEKLRAQFHFNNCRWFQNDLPEATHYSKLDLKSMKVQDIRDELTARNLSPKGIL